MIRNNAQSHITNSSLRMYERYRMNFTHDVALENLLILG